MDATRRFLKKPVEVIQAAPGLHETSLAGRLVMRPEIVRYLFVSYAVGAREDRLAARRAAFSLLEEAAGFGLSVRASALSDRPSVDVVLHPPDGARLTALQLRPVPGTHQLPLFLPPPARGPELGKDGSWNVGFQKSAGVLLRRDTYRCGESQNRILDQ